MAVGKMGVPGQEWGSQPIGSMSFLWVLLIIPISTARAEKQGWVGMQLVWGVQHVSASLQRAGAQGYFHSAEGFIQKVAKNG